MRRPIRQRFDIIRLQKAVFYAYHGAITDEQNLGGKFEVDLDLYCDLLAGSKSDTLAQTVDYTRVYEYVRSLVLGKKYNLIEKLAGTIAEGILKEFKKVEIVTVRVRKPNAPIRGVIDYVEVELTRQRKKRATL